LEYSPPLNQENVLDIISDAMELEKDIIQRIYNPPIESSSDYKNYFRKVSGDFYDGIVELTERLNSLSY
jgi:hypothetical protein